MGLTTDTTDTIKDAVLRTAQHERSQWKRHAEDSVRHTDEARQASRLAMESQQRWEDCIDFLDANFPDWEDELSDEQRERVR